MSSASSLNTTTNNTTATSSSKATSSSSAAHVASNSANTRTSRHYSSSSSSTSSSSTNSPHPACAACKYQRRRCTPDCILAPHFPAHLQSQFQAAHRLFGVKNIHRIIDDLDPVQRSNAMRSIIFESNARVRDPVGGCLRIICELERQIQCDSAELLLVLQQLAICRAQVEESALAPLTSDLAAEANANLIPSGNGDSNIYIEMNQSQQQQSYYYDYFYDDGGSGCENNNNNEEEEEEEDNSSINQNQNQNQNQVVRDEMLQVQELSMLSLQQQQQEQEQQFRIEEEDEVKPICDMFEIRQVLDDEHDSNNIDVIKGGELFPCRLGLGFSCY